MDKKKVIAKLNDALNMELVGVLRYLHYSFMVFGRQRIPIVHFLREQATEGLGHATKLGEKITALGGQSSISVSEKLHKVKHSIDAILKESLEFEKEALNGYKNLLEDVSDDVVMDTFVREFIEEESEHVEEVEKMLREM